MYFEVILPRLGNLHATAPNCIENVASLLFFFFLWYYVTVKLKLLLHIYLHDLAWHKPYNCLFDINPPALINTWSAAPCRQGNHVDRQLFLDSVI